MTDKTHDYSPSHKNYRIQTNIMLPKELLETMIIKEIKKVEVSDIIAKNVEKQIGLLRKEIRMQQDAIDSLWGAINKLRKLDRNG